MCILIWLSASSYLDCEPIGIANTMHDTGAHHEPDAVTNFPDIANPDSVAMLTATSYVDDDCNNISYSNSDNDYHVSLHSDTTENESK